MLIIKFKGLLKEIFSFQYSIFNAESDVIGPFDAK
jgi:hypothetical protein